MEEIFMKNDRLMNSVLENQSSCDHSYVTQLIKFPLNKNEDKFYFNMIVVKKEEVTSIFNSTLEQSNSNKWTEHRKVTISATKYHKIKICKNMSAENQQKIVEIISNDVKLIGKAALNTSYGTQTEMIAIETYCVLCIYVQQKNNKSRTYNSFQIPLVMCITRFIGFQFEKSIIN